MYDRLLLIDRIYGRVCVCCYRNLQELHMEAETMTEESKEMEEKLQQLKESLSKEKEERG